MVSCETALISTALPDSALLVLRDGAGVDAELVLLVAIEDLVRSGVWRHERSWCWSLRRVHRLTPLKQPHEQPEPLASADRLLRRATAAGAGDVRGVGRWIAEHASGAPRAAVDRTIEELVARGLMLRKQISVRIGAQNSGRVGMRSITRTPDGEATCAAALASLTGYDTKTERRRRSYSLGSSRRLSKRHFPAQSLAGVLVGSWAGGYEVGSQHYAAAHHSPAHTAHAGGHGHGGVAGMATAISEQQPRPGLE